MPNFNFKSQFPIADIVNAAQKKPMLEAQMQQMQEEQKNARLKQLLDTLSTSATVTRQISQNKTDDLARQATISQQAGQKDLQSILSEPSQIAPVTKPIQQFGPATPTMGPPAMAPDGSMQPPAPLPPQPTTTAQPTFNQTTQGATQGGRYNAALAKAFPEQAGAQMTARAFADPVDKELKRAQIDNLSEDNKANAARLIEEKRKNDFGMVLDQAKLDIDRQKLGIEREKLKMEALNTGNKLSDGQANALLFGNRAAEANQILANLTGPNRVGPDGKPISSLDPTSLFSGAQGLLPNIAKSGDVQSLEQAKMDFTFAVLRKESGAAIGKDEIKNAYKQYFPSVGDTPNTLAQKTKNREIAIQGLLRQGGKEGQNILNRYKTSSSNAAPGGVPAVGSMFNGGKVLSVERING